MGEGYSVMPAASAGEAEELLRTGPASLSEAVDTGTSTADTLNLDEVQKRTILRALKSTKWNKVHTAEELGIYPSSLYKKLKRLGIPLRPSE